MVTWWISMRGYLLCFLNVESSFYICARFVSTKSRYIILEPSYPALLRSGALEDVIGEKELKVHS